MIDYIGGKGMRYEGCLKKRFSMGKKLSTLQKNGIPFLAAFGHNWDTQYTKLYTQACWNSLS